jgi:hypothetical protein
MRNFLLLSFALSILATAATHESPFACDRTALNPDQRKRHFDELGPKLRSLVLDARELTSGYEFRLPGDQQTFQLIGEWTAGEHVCCPFFDIELRLDREGGPTWIRLTGRPGTKEFIRTDFKAWFKQ